MRKKGISQVLNENYEQTMSKLEARENALARNWAQYWTDCLSGWWEYFGAITERRETKSKQFRITLDTQGKIAYKSLPCSLLIIFFPLIVVDVSVGTDLPAKIQLSNKECQTSLQEISDRWVDGVCPLKKVKTYKFETFTF